MPALPARSAKALLHFLRLIAEQAEGGPEITPTLHTNDKLTGVFDALEKHRVKRDGYARAVRLADMLDGLEELIEADHWTPIVTSVQIDKLLKWARSRNVELRRDEAEQIISWGMPSRYQDGRAP